MIKYQNYSHYKLPITINPLEYGKLIEQIGNKYIIQLNSTNVLIINERENENFIRLFRKGEFIFEFKDLKIDNNSFIRTILDQKYTFKNSKLISTEILSVNGNILIYENTDSFKLIQNFTPLIILLIFLFFNDNYDSYYQLALIPFKNIIKLRKGILNWIDIKFHLKNQLFNKSLLNTKLNKFWLEVFEELSDNQHIWLLFRLQWSNGEYVTIGKLQKLNKEDKDYILNYIIDEMEDKSEFYKTNSIQSMIFSYNIKKGRSKEKVSLDNLNLRYQDFQHHKLPISMNPLKYGLLINKKDNEFTIQINDTNLALIIQEENKNIVKIFRKGVKVYEYFDIKINDSTFIRELLNKKFTFINNELALLTIDKKVKFIKSLKKVGNQKDNIITMDIETFIKDNIHVPYCISWFDGEQTFSYYLTYYKNPDAMIIDCMKDLMVRKYNNYKVYIHNLAGFDANFLLKILVNLGIVKPIIHHGKIISINFKYNKYDVTFRDSRQLLNASLRSLGEAFNVEITKSIFPYSYTHENNLNYNSHVPEFKYFSGISKIEYQDYMNQFIGKLWNLEIETVKYCNIDCISLYQILIKFNSLIYKLFEINIHKHPTLSSLAFAIYRTHFLKKDTIAQLSGQIAKDIRQSYTGGAVDMYIPENLKGEEVYGYDVNSLYPSQMESQLMPINHPTLFYGDIRKVDPNAFGFFYCKIKAPDNLEHPILQTHIKTNNGMRTIAPLGVWSDMLFSKEIDNAMKYGYKFEIIWGYTFKSGIIFKEYVNTLYKLRSDYPKSNPINYLAKLLLNSLYGRFGMIDQFPEIVIFNNPKEMNVFIEKFSGDIIDIIELGDKILVKYISDDTKRSTMLYANLETHNVNIAIASCITGYSRIHMSQFKNNIDFKLYYSDTDSVYIDRPLPTDIVNSKIIGKMKLENVLEKAIFLAPKVYYLETIDGKIIYKVKGLSHDIELNKIDFEKLLFKESTLEKFQTKWIKKLSKGQIEVIDQLYTLQVTDNKRKLIYDENNKFIKTEAFVINDKKEIINK